MTRPNADDTAVPGAEDATTAGATARADSGTEESPTRGDSEADETATRGDEGIGLEVGIDWLRLLPYALALAVAITLLVAATTSTAAFGLFNPSWEGATEFRSAIDDDPATDSEVVRETTEYDALEPVETTALVVAPDSTYDPDAVAHVRQFVDDGGTLVVLDSVGADGNALLEGVGAEARFDGRLVRDERYHAEGPLLPTATSVADHELTADVDRLTLNHGTVIDAGGDGPALEGTDSLEDDAASELVRDDGTIASATDDGTVTPLVATSKYAQLESRSADAGDAAETPPTATYPVATTEAIGDGRVVAVADPSLAINAMIDRSDNEAFLHGLHADTAHVAFDRSHGDDLPPIATALETVRGSWLLQVLIGGVAIGGLGLTTSPRARRLVVAGRDRLGELVAVIAGGSARAGSSESTRSRGGIDPGLSASERARYLRRRHPEWSEGRIERLRDDFDRPTDGLTTTDE